MLRYYSYQKFLIRIWVQNKIYIESINKDTVIKLKVKTKVKVGVESVNKNVWKKWKEKLKQEWTKVFATKNRVPAQNSQNLTNFLY